MTAADRHRARVYEAAVPDDRKFGDIDAVQRYVDAVLALDRVRRAAPERAALPVRVRARAGAAKAVYEAATHTIAVPPHRVGGRWAMRELVVLHEIAHHLAPGTGHGPPFVTTLLQLVEDLVGPEAGFLLRSALLDAGVEVA
jgi:putative metallohydrolase (TIGR04338 family)